MDDAEFDRLVRKITTWDQAHLDTLVGPSAIEYAEDHERDVRRLANEMRSCFPLGRRWWILNSALGDPLRRKNQAIKDRAAQIKRDRAVGKIIERDGRLVYARTHSEQENQLENRLLSH